MITAFDSLRELSMVSVLLRLSLAMVCGGLIGIERGRKRRAAGLRTYMLVCLGATLSVILSQYFYVMLTTVWSVDASLVGRTTDVSRIAAKVIGGIGFLGTGTIIITGKQEVKGLTTAAGLWASASLGIAVGNILLAAEGVNQCQRRTCALCVKRTHLRRKFLLLCEFIGADQYFFAFQDDIPPE